MVVVNNATKKIQCACNKKINNSYLQFPMKIILISFQTIVCIYHTFQNWLLLTTIEAMWIAKCYIIMSMYILHSSFSWKNKGLLLNVQQ